MLMRINASRQYGDGGPAEGVMTFTARENH